MRTDIFWFRNSHSRHGAHASADTLTMSLGHAMERSRVMVMPCMFSVVIVVVFIMFATNPELPLLLRMLT